MKRAFFAAIVCSFCLVAQTGNATLDTIQPGHDCRIYSEQDEDDYFDPTGLKANGLKNTASVAKPVTCGITKEAYQDTQNVFISFSDPTADCDLYKRSFDGSSWGSWGPTQVIGNSPRLQAWGAMGGYATSGYALSIYCNVSSNVVINSYEHDGY